MQGAIEESPSRGQARHSITNSKIAEDSHLPDLPAYYDLDKKYTTSSSEIWSFYLYNSGGSLLYFAPIALQSLLTQAEGGGGVLFFAGR